MEIDVSAALCQLALVLQFTFLAVEFDFVLAFLILKFVVLQAFC